MPNCIVKGCNNHTSRDQKQYGITFHTFPIRDQKIKEKWIAVIRDSRKEPSWQPTSRSVVCSAHFHIDDLYYTKKGLRRVIKNQYPKILPNIIIEGEDNGALSQHPNVQDEPAAPDLSNDLNLSQPYTTCAILPNIIEGIEYQDVSQPPYVQEKPATDLSNDLNLSPSSSLRTVETVQSDLFICDTPREDKLRRRVLLLEKKLQIKKKKIKTLNQKVRRLHMRNKSLREELDNLRK